MGFDSGRRVQGELSLVFDRPGALNYHCQIHPEMHGTVVVSR